MAILGSWDDEQAGGPALLRACGVTAEQAGQVADTLVAAHEAGEADPGAEPRVVGALRFVLDQAERIAAEAIEPLEELEVPTPAAAMLGELARQQAEQHPVEGRFMFGKNLDDPEWSLMRIHPGTSGLAPRAVLHRLLGSAS